MPRNGLNESTSLRMPTVNVPAPPPSSSPLLARALLGLSASAGEGGGNHQREGRQRGSTFPPMPTREGPPVARQEPFEHTEHGVARPDPYAWMRRLDEPVLAHLAAEREWYDVATGHLGPLVQQLRAEMADRVPATDSSVSWPQHEYSYRTVLPAGREYVQLLRRRHGDEAERAAARRERDGR